MNEMLAAFYKTRACRGAAKKTLIMFMEFFFILNVGVKLMIFLVNNFSVVTN